MDWRQVSSQRRQVIDDAIRERLRQKGDLAYAEIADFDAPGPTLPNYKEIFNLDDVRGIAAALLEAHHCRGCDGHDLEVS